jgi:hypothetical protein
MQNRKFREMQGKLYFSSLRDKQHVNSYTSALIVNFDRNKFCLNVPLKLKCVLPVHLQCVLVTDILNKLIIREEWTHHFLFCLGNFSLYCCQFAVFLD